MQLAEDLGQLESRLLRWVLHKIYRIYVYVYMCIVYIVYVRVRRFRMKIACVLKKQRDVFCLQQLFVVVAVAVAGVE